MSVYVLGAGGVGTLISSALAKNFNVNFIVRNIKKIEHLSRNNNSFQITKLFDENKLTNYKINGAFTTTSIPDKNIDFLLVCVKTFDTVDSIKPLLEYINTKTRILLVQNGMGVVDELYSKVWKKIEERPAIYQGVISHGVWQPKEHANTYNYNHAGYGYLKICQVPRDLNNTESLDTSVIDNDPIVNSLVKSDLNVTKYSYDELLVYQIQKFLVNCCMNASTSIIDCLNYKLSNIEETNHLFKSIVSEGLEILYKSYPILQSSKLAQELLTVDKQVDFVRHVGFTINSKNSTSMRQDVLNLRDTEIDYINGHIVKKALENNLTAPVSQTICHLLKMRLAVNRINHQESLCK